MALVVVLDEVVVWALVVELVVPPPLPPPPVLVSSSPHATVRQAVAPTAMRIRWVRVVSKERSRVMVTSSVKQGGHARCSGS